MWKFVKSALEKDTWLDCKNGFMICFWGRSNVGKSTLLNALVNQKISFVSSQPGRTQYINYFQEGNNFIIDLPGYGYAKMPKEKLKQMNENVKFFLKHDKTNKEIFLLIDARVGFTKNDLETVNFLNSLKWPYQIVYTKIDKLKQKDKSRLVKNHNELLAKNICKTDTKAFLVSSEKGVGLDELIEHVASLIYLE